MKKQTRKFCGRRKALALVAVLWLIVLLTVIVTVLANTARLDTRICISTAEHVRNRWACRAGVEKAAALLNEDPTASDCLTDLWSENDLDCNNIELDGCLFSVKIVDEAAKLNINTVPRGQLLHLADMTEEIADAIIDWRDKNDNPRAEGAEAGYYSNLPYPYQIRNAPFRTVRELLLVKDVTEDMLYGEDTNLNGKLDYNERDGSNSPPHDNADDVLDEGWVAQLTCSSYDNNKDASGNQRININKADENKLVEELKIDKAYAKWIVENRKKQENKDNQYQSIADLIDDKSPREPKKISGENSDKAEPLDLQTFREIADRLTTTDDTRIVGRVNVNTASKAILTALLGDQDIAAKIIDHRDGLADGMQSIAELLNISSIKVKTFKKIANDITTRSSVFSARCWAAADRTGAVYQVEAILDRAASPCEILYWHQGANR